MSPQPTPEKRWHAFKKKKNYQDQRDGPGVKSTVALAQDPGSTPSVQLQLSVTQVQGDLTSFSDICGHLGTQTYLQAEH